MKEEIRNFIVNELLDGHPVTDSEDLLLSGLLDSLGVMRLVAYLEMDLEVAVPPEDVTIDEYVRRNVCNLAHAHEYCREKLRCMQDRMARTHDKRVKHAPSKKVGEWVLTFVQANRGKVRKLQRKFQGPFQVRKVYNNGTHYKLSNGKKVHHEYLRPFDHKIHHLAVDETGEFMYSHNGTDEPLTLIEPPEIWTDERERIYSDKEKKKRKKNPAIEHEEGPYDVNNYIPSYPQDISAPPAPPNNIPDKDYLEEQNEANRRNTLLPGQEFSPPPPKPTTVTIDPQATIEPGSPDPIKTLRLDDMFESAYDPVDENQVLPDLDELLTARNDEIHQSSPDERPEEVHPILQPGYMQEPWDQSPPAQILEETTGDQPLQQGVQSPEIQPPWLPRKRPE